ncbi:MAG: SOS response-associated peptidase [Clostridiales bacterium]|nr:SOS response-associated peptidase [Clostridiales bacterium]
MDGDVLYLAGFFDLMENEERFVILTTSANKSMSVVHDRMPLVLEEAQITDWIIDDKSTEEFLRQVPGALKRQKAGWLYLPVMNGAHRGNFFDGRHSMQS